jgi:hypothetical protein
VQPILVKVLTTTEFGQGVLVIIQQRRTGEGDESVCGVALRSGSSAALRWVASTVLIFHSPFRNRSRSLPSLKSGYAW